MKKHFQFSFFFVCIFIVMSCNSTSDNNTSTNDTYSPKSKNMITSYPTTGSIEVLDPALNDIIAPGTEIEILTEGFDWSEGPLWIEAGNYVIFSDIPPNKIMKWKEGEGLSLYLTPSGYTGEAEFTGREAGSNALILNFR